MLKNPKYGLYLWGPASTAKCSSRILEAFMKAEDLGVEIFSPYLVFSISVFLLWSFHFGYGWDHYSKVGGGA